MTTSPHVPESPAARDETDLPETEAPTKAGAGPPSRVPAPTPVPPSPIISPEVGEGVDTRPEERPPGRDDDSLPEGHKPRAPCLGTVTAGRRGKSSGNSRNEEHQAGAAPDHGHGHGRRARQGRPPLSARNAALLTARDEDPRPTYLDLARRFGLSEGRVAEIVRAHRRRGSR